MPTRRIFGYIGFILSLLIAYYYAFVQYHDPAEGLGVMLMLPVIMVVVTTFTYFIG
jgi:cytochrome c-type biogenesis protein CcmH/NrfF